MLSMALSNKEMGYKRRHTIHHAQTFCFDYVRNYHMKGQVGS